MKSARPENIEASAPGQAALIVPDHRDDAKRLSTIRAALALQGHELLELPSSMHPKFRVCRWGLYRDLRDLDEAEAFLRQIGGGL